MRRFVLSGLILTFLTSPVPSQSSKTRLLSDRIVVALSQEISGTIAKDTVIALSRFHRVQASSGFADAAALIAARCRSYGLENVAIEHFPADGKTTYDTLTSVPGWEARAAQLWETSPLQSKIADLAEMNVALADYSTAGDVTADLVDVGDGTSAKDYEGKVVKDRIVLAGGPVAAVHTMAVGTRGAAGILSYQPNQVTGWSGDFDEIVRWGHLSPYNEKNTFAFMISLRKARELRTRLGKGERIVLRATVDAIIRPSTIDVVTATIPGTDLASEEIVFSCHLCHQKPGANDNASGSAAILEIARALQSLIGSGVLPRPRRTIRFLWPPEINGTVCYFARHPDKTKRMKAAIHLDMVGGNFAITKSVLHITRTPASLPSSVSDVAEEFGEYAIEGSKRAAMDGDFSDALLSPEGSKDALVADATPYEMGSDHDVYQEGSYRVPAIYLRDWPDVFIHTNRDTPDNIDPTKMKRSAFIAAASGYFLATAGGSEARLLAEVAYEHALETIIGAAGQAAKRIRGSDHRTSHELAEAANLIEQTSIYRRKALLWTAELAPADASLKRELGQMSEALQGVARSFKERLGIPEASPARSGAGTETAYARNPKIAGPMNVYYYNYVSDHATLADREAFQKIPAPASGGLVMYETLNLVNGKRSVSEIRDIISGSYGTDVSEAFVAAYLALLEKIGVVERNNPRARLRNPAN